VNKILLMISFICFSGNVVSESYVNEIPTTYEDKNWDKYFKDKMTEGMVFVHPNWKSIITMIPPPLKNDSMEEIKAMHKLIPLREQNAAEIKKQNTRIFSYYLSEKELLNTDLILFSEIIIREALIVALEFKNRFSRPRPWVLDPSLKPIISPPGHPSYPSAHSTQSHLLAYALNDIYPDKSLNYLLGIADQISINREIGGVHYSSDTVAGRQLALDIFVLLKQSQKYRDYTRKLKGSL